MLLCVIKLCFVRAFCAFFLLISIPVAGSATTVFFDVTNINGNTWEYTYNITNDTLRFDIEEFTIFFDPRFYENLNVTSTPINWDSLVIQPDLNIPDDGFYDAQALVAGISPEASFNGFGVQFDYLGTGAPSQQLFNIVDPNTFALLDFGMTQAVVVPLPAAMWLFGSGALSLFGLSRYRYRIQRTDS